MATSASASCSSSSSSVPWPRPDRAYVQHAPFIVSLAGHLYVYKFNWWFALGVGVPVGLLAAALLQANNLRDIGTDSESGKKTLAVRLGRRRAGMFYCFHASGASKLRHRDRAHCPWSLLALLAFPWPSSRYDLRSVTRRGGPPADAAGDDGTTPDSSGDRTPAVRRPGATPGATGPDRAESATHNPARWSGLGPGARRGRRRGPRMRLRVERDGPAARRARQSDCRPTPPESTRGKGTPRRPHNSCACRCRTGAGSTPGLPRQAAEPFERCAVGLQPLEQRAATMRQRSPRRRPSSRSARACQTGAVPTGFVLDGLVTPMKTTWLSSRWAARLAWRATWPRASSREGRRAHCR